MKCPKCGKDAVKRTRAERRKLGTGAPKIGHKNLIDEVTCRKL